MEPSPKKRAKLKESRDDPNAPDDPPDGAEDSAAVDPAAAISHGSDVVVSAEESLLIRRRAMNTIHSRRKRERQRIEIEVLKEQCAEYNAKNSKLRHENAQLELLLRSLPPQISALGAPPTFPPPAATRPTPPNLPPSASFLTAAAHNDASFRPSFPPVYATPSWATGDLGRRATTTDEAPPTAHANDVWMQQIAALAMAQLQQQQWQQQLLQQQQQLQQQLQPTTSQHLLASLPPSLNIQLLQQLIQAQYNATPRSPDPAEEDASRPPPV
jgi:hypothetical protein